MPVIKAKPSAVIPPALPPVKIAKEGFKSIAVDTQYNPKETILAHIEGYSWTVTYYSQVLGRDTGAAGQGIATDPVLQQYRRINNMEIKVTTPLNTSQAEDTAEMLTQGSANCYPHVIPNKGDMFVADIMDGRQGIFQITSVQRLTVMRETCHAIDYVLVDFGTTARLSDLASKVVQEAYFVKDFIYHGQNPILLGQDYENYNYLRRNLSLLVSQYFKRFYSVEYSTLILPDQHAVTYDHFVVNALFSHLDTRDARQLTHLRRLNVDDDQAMSADSIWDVLMTRERSMMQDIFHEAGLVTVKRFQSAPVFEGIRYSGVKYAVYPKDPMVRVDNQYGQFIKEAGDIEPVHIPTPNRKYLGPQGEDLTLKGIKNVMEDGFYIFSKAFYENSREENAQSAIELAVNDHIDGKEIDYARLRELVQASAYWNSLNSFYYVPVLIILIKSVIRGI